MCSSFFQNGNKDFIITFKKYISTVQMLNYYSQKEVKTDTFGNYLFPISQESDIYNDRTLMKWMGSFTNNHEIKVYTHIDIEHFDIPPEKYQKDMLGLYYIVINTKNDFLFSVFEREVISNIPQDLPYKCDAYHGFIPKDDCNHIKIYVGQELFQEYKYCKKGYYYSLEQPLLMFIMRDLIRIEIDSSTKIDFVISYFGGDKSSFRGYVMDFVLRDDGKLFGTCLGKNLKDQPRLIYYNMKKYMIEYDYPSLKKDMIFFHSQKDMYITQMKTRYIRKELVEKTWNLDRFQDWCLPYDT